MPSPSLLRPVFTRPLSVFAGPLRGLRQAPGFAVAAVALLALGIGAATAVFAMIDAVLLRPLVADQPERLVRIFATDEQHREISGNASYPVYQDYRAASTLDGLVAFADWEVVHLGIPAREPGSDAVGTVTAGAPGGVAQAIPGRTTSFGSALNGDAGSPAALSPSPVTAAERVDAGVASGELFTLLGTRPAHGRLFAPGDDLPGTPPVAVLTWRSFQNRFDGDPAVVGSTVLVNGQPVTVIGVAAPSFRGLTLNAFPELWLPLAAVTVVDPELARWNPFSERGFSYLDLIGRLAPGRSLAAAQTELDAIATARAATQPADRRDPWPLLLPAAAAAVDPGNARIPRVAWLLVAVGGVVLLVAGSNAAGLSLARGMARRRELAVRAALGARPAALIAAASGEGLLLAAAATALAPLACGLLLRLAANVASGLPLPLDAAGGPLSPRNLGFALAAGAVSALLFALGPAIAAARRDPVAALRADGVVGAGVSGGSRLGVRRGLVALQASLAMALLVGGGLLAHTLRSLRDTPLGFEPSGVAVGMIDLARHGYRGEEATRVAEAVRQALVQVPGVTAASLASHVPVSATGMRSTVVAEGYVPAPDEPTQVNFNPVSPGYFATIGIPLLTGREFATTDDASAPPVVIVNQAFADRYFAGANPVGRFLLDSHLSPSARPADAGPPWRAEIVGLAGNVRERSLRESSPPLYYVPLTQFFRPRLLIAARVGRQATGAVPGEGEPRGADTLALAALQTAVRQVDSTLPLIAARSLAARIDRELVAERTLTAVVSAAGLLALLLAASGIAALVAVLVRSRSRELAVRAALGATPRRLATNVWREIVGVAAVGSLAGGLGALWAATLAGELLLPGGNQLALALAVPAGLLLLLTASIATFPSVWRAAHTQPASVLREG